MSIPVTCPNCKGRLNLLDRHAGQVIECPDCGEGIAVPGERLRTIQAVAVAEPTKPKQPFWKRPWFDFAVIVALITAGLMTMAVVLGPSKPVNLPSSDYYQRIEAIDLWRVHNSSPSEARKLRGATIEVIGRGQVDPPLGDLSGGVIFTWRGQQIVHCSIPRAYFRPIPAEREIVVRGVCVGDNESGIVLLENCQPISN